MTLRNLLILGATLALAGCGGSSPGTHAPHARRRAAAHTARPVVPRPVGLVDHPLYALPAPLRDPAAVALGGQRFALLGGLDAADVSTDEVDVGDPRGTVQRATLPEAQHDAQGAELVGRVYVFGGGSLSELDHILAFDPAAGTVTAAGSLPSAQSDVAVAAAGGTAYVVGGYDGVNWKTTILAYRPGGPPRVAGTLPVGLRYAAATPVPGGILIFGGSTPTGAASDAILRFDPLTGRVRQIGRLPAPLTHAGAATLDGTAYLVGGRGTDLGTQSDQVLAIDPATGRVTRAGRLPTALSDEAVVAVDGGIIVAGGLTTSGATSSEVSELLPR